MEKEIILNADIEKKITYTNFILISYAPFFGSLLINAIPIKIVENGNTTIYTNGKTIFVNKAFGNEIDKKVFAAFVLKNLLHIVFRHKQRMKMLDKQKIRYAVASSYAIASIIIDEIKNDDDLFKYLDYDENIMVYKKEFKDMSAEQIYDELSHIKDDDKILKKSKDGTPNTLIDIQKFDSEKELDTFTKELLNALSLYAVMDDEDMTQDDEDKLTMDILSADFQARNTGHGNTPLGVQRLIDEIRKPKVNWRHELTDFASATCSEDYDFSERDRRSHNSNFFLPSLTGESIKIAIAVDTSGSVSDEDLKNALSEIYGIFKTYNKVDLFLISCDAQVGNAQKIENEEDLFDFDFIGGGGTDFRPVFDLVEEDGDYKAIIFFTDGAGSYPEDSSVPTIWLMTDDIIAPFGKTVKYENDTIR
jgi:predicted metal-dependent peptidase